MGLLSCSDRAALRAPSFLRLASVRYQQLSMAGGAVLERKISFPSFPEPSGYPTLALAGFAGVNAPLLALAASSFMVCGGGQPGCAL
jgi:hypothetical protein